MTAPPLPRRIRSGQVLYVQGPARRPVDDFPRWMPGGLVAAEFAAGMDWPDCQCPRCVPCGTAGGGA